MIRAVIFDMDGLILDTEKLYCRFWMEAAREAGYDWQMCHSLNIRSMASEFSEPYLKSIFGEDFDRQAIRRRRNELMDAYLADHPIEKKPGIDELLDYLKSHYYKRAVATATNETKAMNYLDEVGLLNDFDQIISAPTVPHGKPMPDVYLYACRRLVEKPEDCIALEDSPNGIMAAYRAGCKPVMVPDLTQPDEELSKILYGKADSLKDVIHFLS
jgi:HAD superfamily hydrolase (TIGR01509 family)